jgi:peptidyl-prolyl cis-trans isomerase C
MFPKRFLTVALTLILLGSLTTMAAERKKAPSVEELQASLAQLNLNAGNYSQAIAGYSDMLETYPKSRLAKDYAYNLGLAYERSGDYQKAAEVYQKVVTLYKDKPNQVANVDSLAMEGVGRCFNKNFKEYAVVINGQPITKLEFDAELEKVPPQYRGQFESESGRKQFLDRLVQKALLSSEALKLGIQNDPQIHQQIEDSRTDILIRGLYNREVIQKSVPSDLEISKYYQENKESYKIPEQVKARNIVVNSRPEAEKVLKLAQAKKAFFDSLAIKYSVSANAPKGGEMVPQNPGGDPSMDKALFRTPKGKISAVTPLNPRYAVVKRLAKDGAKLHLRWIVLNTEEEAQKLISEIKANPSQFDSLAGKRSSDASTRDKAGDLGMVAKGDVNEDVWKAAQKLKDGGFTMAPVKYYTQYAIYKIEDKTPAGYKALDQVKSQISSQLSRDRQKTSFEQLMERLKSAAKIEYPEESQEKAPQPEPKPEEKNN